MRAASFLSALIACGLAGPALAQIPDPRPALAVVVVPVDEARQGQIKHGRRVLAALGDGRFGRFTLVEPTVPATDFESCEDDRPGPDLSFCARFYQHRADPPAPPSHVVVALADWTGPAPENHRGTMRAQCFGRGAEAFDPKAQDIWLWPDSARVHGVRAWERDKDALAACIEAALSEPPGQPRPGAF